MDLDKLKPIVNDPIMWGKLANYFEMLYNNSIQEISNAETDRQMYRIQGEMRLLRKLKSLKEVVNSGR